MSETLAEALQRIIKQRGMNPTNVSVAAGLGKTAVRDIIEGRSRRPHYETLAKIAGALGVEPGELFQASGVSTAFIPPSVFHAAKPNSAKVGVPGRSPINGMHADRTLPVFGTARGGLEGSFHMPVDERPIDWTFRPPQLAHVKDAYAVLMVGSSMEPRYMEGCLLWVNPGLPTPVGKDVLIVLHDDRAMVKRLSRRSAAHIIVSQYGEQPGELPPIALTDIRTLHRIVGSWDA